MDESLLQNNKINNIQNDIEIVKENITDNMQKILDRGKNIEEILDQTDRLDDQSLKFLGASKSLKRKLLCDNIKYYGCILLSISLIVFIIIVAFCGGLKFDKC